MADNPPTTATKESIVEVADIPPSGRNKMAGKKMAPADWSEFFDVIDGESSSERDLTDLSLGEAFRAAYDSWVKLGGYNRGKPRRSVRQMKEWLGQKREIRSLETKLAGKTYLQLSDIKNLIDLFLEYFDFDPKTELDAPYSIDNREAVAGIVAKDIMKRLGEDGERGLLLPERKRNGSHPKPLMTSDMDAVVHAASVDDSRPTRDALIERYMDSDALITVSRESTFAGAGPHNMLLVHKLLDAFRLVDEKDDRFRALIWIADLGRRESDFGSQAALQNLEFLATQLRSFQLTYHDERDKRRRWLQARSVILVGTLTLAEIDSLYAGAGFKPATPNADVNWVTGDRLLFAGIPPRWLPTIAKRSIETLDRQTLTVHCDRSKRRKGEPQGEPGEDVSFLLHFPGQASDGTPSLRCIELPHLGVRWNDAFRMAHDVALLRLLGKDEKSDLRYTPSESLGLLRQHRFAVLKLDEFLQLSNRLVFQC